MQIDLKIVTNYSDALNFRKLEKFKLDLGKTLVSKNQERNTLFQDEFQGKFFMTENEIPYKIGNYGSLKFYYSQKIPSGICQFWTGNKIHEAKMDESNLKAWLNEQIKYIIEDKKNTTNEDETSAKNLG